MFKMFHTYSGPFRKKYSPDKMKKDRANRSFF